MVRKINQLTFVFHLNHQQGPRRLSSRYTRQFSKLADKRPFQKIFSKFHIFQPFPFYVFYMLYNSINESE